MDHDEPADLVGWINLIPAMAMALFWLLPMTLFWGMAFGPLKDPRSTGENTSPSIVAFMIGCVASLAPLTLPRSLDVPKDRRRAQRIYERLGVRQFKRFVVDGDLVTRFARQRHPAYQRVAGRGELEAFLERTRAVERWHLVLLLMTFLSAGYAVRIGWYRWAITLTLGNVICNLYPILLQRYHRGRIRPFPRGHRPGQ